ncbi:hypothetical protein GJ496_004070 [Pomphorhynchus laevis]|nr:hypothetical protein GJ496_004070 [Pomphorhynchus laevis]
MSMTTCYYDRTNRPVCIDDRGNHIPMKVVDEMVPVPVNTYQSGLNIMYQQPGNLQATIPPMILEASPAVEVSEETFLVPLGVVQTQPSVSALEQATASAVVTQLPLSQTLYSTSSLPIQSYMPVMQSSSYVPQLNALSTSGYQQVVPNRLATASNNNRIKYTEKTRLQYIKSGIARKRRQLV